MAEFQYQGRNDRGELIQGRVDGESERLVARMLLNNGVTPVRIQLCEVRENWFEALDKKLQYKKPTLVDLIMFCKQMHTLTKSGVPIVRAMNGLSETTRNLVLKDTIRDIARNLESGHSLTQAFNQHNDVFPRLFISTIHVGENAGRLDLAFSQVAAYLEHEQETQARIKSAMRYPVMVLVAIGVAMIIINLFVIPSFARVFESFHAELPWSTRILVASSNAMIAYWPAMLASVLAAAYGVRHYLATSIGRYQWDRTKLRLPLIGGIIEKATMSRFTRSFEMILNAGVPLIEGITIVSYAVGNDFVGEKIREMRQRIESGDSLSRTASAMNLFPPLVLQMIAVGEESGNVADMMSDVSDYYEREVDDELKNLSSAIEPVMILIIGAMVLVLAMGVFLPMWELGGAAQGR